MKFADLGLSDELLAAVHAKGYDTPTAIQAQAIPSVLMMRDIIGIAQTGTGKTAGFVLPMLARLESGRARARMPRSLILAPTRELATQHVLLRPPPPAGVLIRHGRLQFIAADARSPTLHRARTRVKRGHGGYATG